MPVNVSFGKTDKRRNSLFVPSVGQSFPCLLKDMTSVIEPTIQLEYEGYPDWNYCYISEFNRYYYIVDIVSETAYIWNITCIVDVLATYSNEIKSTSAFIMYSETLHYPMIPDTRMPITDSFASEAAVIQSWNVYNETGVYITSIISKGSSQGGFAKVYALSSGELNALADRMLDPSILDSVKDYYLGQPADAVVGCTWIPIGQAYAGQGSSEITAFGNELGISGTTAIMVIEGEVQLSVPLRYIDQQTGSWQDFRNFEPFAKYSIILPGVGEVELPMISIASQQDGGTSVAITAKYSISVIDGVVTWAVGGSGFKPALVCSGSIGTSMPVGSRQVNIGDKIGSATQAVMGVLTMSAGVLSGNPLMAVGGAMAGINGLASNVKADQGAYGASGSIGGRGMKEINSQITVIRKNYMTTDTEYNVKDVIGMPYFAKATIGSSAGLTKCTGANVKCGATEREHQMIAQYVNCSENYIYGGIIVE